MFESNAELVQDKSTGLTVRRLEDAYVLEVSDWEALTAASKRAVLVVLRGRVPGPEEGIFIDEAQALQSRHCRWQLQWLFGRQGRL